MASQITAKAPLRGGVAQLVDQITLSHTPGLPGESLALKSSWKPLGQGGVAQLVGRTIRQTTPKVDQRMYGIEIPQKHSRHPIGEGA